MSKVDKAEQRIVKAIETSLNQGVDPDTLVDILNSAMVGVQVVSEQER